MTTNQNYEQDRIALAKANAKWNALYMAVEDIKNRIEELDVNNYADHDYKIRREALEALKYEMIERCNAASDEKKAAGDALAKAYCPCPLLIGK